MNQETNKPLMTNGELLSTYYARINELKSYRITELTENIIGIYKDYIVGCFNKKDNIIKLKVSDLETQYKINSYFKELNLVEEIKNHLSEIIYYGQYCIKVDWDKENKKFIKYDLHNPYDVVSVVEKGKIVETIIKTKIDEGILASNASDTIIIRFGKPNLYLINDINKFQFCKTGKSDLIINNNKFITGYPLYYNLIDKIKEYSIREKIIPLSVYDDLIDKNNIDISNYVNKFREEQELLKEAIITSLGISKAIINGEVSKWEAIKTSERLNSKVNSIINDINDGLIYTASRFYHIITGEEIDLKDIECNLFNKTLLDYERMLVNTEIANNLTGNIDSIITQFKEIFGGNVFDSKEYSNFTDSMTDLIFSEFKKN